MPDTTEKHFEIDIADFLLLPRSGSVWLNM